MKTFHDDPSLSLVNCYRAGARRLAARILPTGLAGTSFAGRVDVRLVLHAVVH
ncbi:MAG: hypothetical protein ACYC9J_04760 [Sulfuricaulis sp.]